MFLTGNPDIFSWKKLFFDNSDGTMQINFEEDLKNFIDKTDYEKVGLFKWHFLILKGILVDPCAGAYLARVLWVL